MAEKKLTNIEVVGALNSIGSIDKEEFSTKTAFRLASVAKSLSEAAETYQEQREKILEKYTETDDDGNPVHPEDEETGEIQEDRVKLTDTEAFNEEMTELANEEVSVTLRVDLSMEDFDDEDVKLNPSKLTPLLAVLED